MYPSAFVSIPRQSSKPNRSRAKVNIDTQHDPRNGARIVEVCHRFREYPFLLSIPNFGPDVSANVLGALGSPY